MALGVSFLSLLIISLSLLLLTSADHTLHLHERHHPNGIKSLQFTLYIQETLNKTAYLIVKGVAGSTETLDPFGTLYAFHDPLTATPDPASKVVGASEGSAIISSFNGQQMTCISRITLKLKGYKGTLLSVGTVEYSIRQSELPMVGGTGDFRYVQGYMTMSPVNLSGATTCYKLDFHLHWPPFAALFAKVA